MNQSLCDRSPRGAPAARGPTRVASARAWLAPVASALLLPVPLISFFHEAGLRPNYPLSPQYNHTGITTFLRKIVLGGTVLLRPDRGGFLAWELYPRYQLTSDMQSPFLFNEEDMYVALNVFHEPLLFADMVSTSTRASCRRIGKRERCPSFEQRR